jgi:glyoxylase-like metal-dependent hydrolase (beta-lactamase superfamily II)
MSRRPSNEPADPAAGGSRESAVDPGTAPAVEAIRDGVWSLRLPMAGPLAHVYAYAVALDDGVLLIDAGPDTDAAFDALRDGLRALGSGLAQVRGVLFTHGHPDHFGAATRVRAASDAWLGLHAADAELLARTRSEGRDEGLELLERWLAGLGAGAHEVEGILDMVRAFPQGLPHPRPDRPIAHGDTFPVAGSELVALHTPGHAPGHVCFVHRGAELVFTGDHVLAPTTPNVNINRFTTGNPLAEYMAALGRMLELGDIVGLPGHQRRLPVARRAAEIIDHHETQLASVAGILGAGPRTVREVAGEMRWALPWDSMGPGSIMMAMGEALAHLALLERRGVAEPIPSDAGRWRVRARASRTGLSDRGTSAGASPCSS